MFLITYDDMDTRVLEHTDAGEIRATRVRKRTGMAARP